MAPELDEEAQARADVWKHIFGFIKSSVLVCAVELEIPDILQNHGGPISLSDLSAAVACPSEPLHRVMRFLTHYNIFKKAPPASDDHNNSSPPPVYYAQTALSRLLTGDNLAAFMLLQGSPLSRGPVGVTAQALRTGENRFLKSVQGEDSWTDPAFGFHMKVFTDAMAAHTKVTTAAVVENFPEMFEGIGSVVDVGGRHGRSLSLLVKAFPWVRGTCFDLPEIVAKAPPCDGVEFVGGNMFESVPKADAVMLMWILHDWSDEACIEILKKCKEAIPKDTGKVVIVDAIIDEDDEYTEARLLLDMFMMAVTVKGKERTYGEWAHLLNEADFSSFTVKSIKTMEFVIQAYP